MSTKAIQNIIISLVVLTFLIPFIVINTMYFPYIVGKAMFFRMIVSLMIIFWGFLCYKDSRFLPSKNNILFSFLALVVFYFIADILGPDIRESFFSNFERMTGWFTTFLLFIFFLITSSVVKQKETWNKIFFIQIGTSLILFLIGLKDLLEFGINFRIAATLGNPIYLSVIFLFSIFFAGYLFFENYSKKTKIFLFSTILINGLGVFFTGTRGAMVALFVSFLLIGILFLIKYWGDNKIRKIGLSLLLLVVLLPVLLFVFQDSKFVKENSTLRRITQINIVEGTGYARFVNWGIGIQGIKERPFLGWGQENYVYVYDKYYDPRMYGQEPYFDSSHNTLIDVFVDGGIFALISYVSIFIFAIIYLFRSDFINKDQKIILLGLFIAYFVQNIFVFDNITSYILFTILISFVISEKENEKECLIVKKVILPVGIILGISIIYFLIFIPWTANQNLLKGMQFFAINREGQAVLKYPNGIKDNLNYFQKALENNYTGVYQIKFVAAKSIDDLRKIKSNDQGLIEDTREYTSFVLRSLTEEVEKNPDDAQVKYITAVAMIQLGSFEEAENLLNQAIEISPKRHLYLALLASLKKVMKKNEEYLNLTEKIYRLEESNDKALFDFVSAASSIDKNKLNEILSELNNEDKIEKIIKITDVFVEQNPDDVNSYINKVVILARIGLFDESIKALDVATEKFPEISSQVKIWKASLEKGELPK